MTTQQPLPPDSSRRLTVVRGTVGWEVREEREGQIVHSSHYTDWHRVERALARHEKAASEDRGPRT